LRIVSKSIIFIAEPLEIIDIVPIKRGDVRRSNNMTYTPELSKRGSSTLRRIAWAAGIPMTKTAEEIMEFLPLILDKATVCKKCRDKSKCKECTFYGRQSKTKGKRFSVLLKTE